MRHRGLRWLHRHGHLDSVAVHTLDAPDHAGGWSVDASVTIPGWDRHGLELLDRFAKLIIPPRIHKHRYCGVFAPNACLRRAVIESAGPAGATLHILQEARQKMGLQEVDPSDTGPTSGIRRTAARCWALLLARIYECLPLQCPRCGEPKRIIAFILEPPVIERILLHLGEPVAAPAVLPAQASPQMELELSPANAPSDGWATDNDQGVGTDEWPDMDQTAGDGGDTWG